MNQLCSTDFVSSLVYLSELDLSFNKIQNVSALAEMKELKELNLKNNEMSLVSERLSNNSPDYGCFLSGSS